MKKKNQYSNSSHYHCETCGHDFDIGKPWFDGQGQDYKRCPECESWNYGLANLSLKNLGDGIFTVDYVSPSTGMTLFSSRIKSEAQKVLNRFWNLTWEQFQEIAAGNSVEKARLYLAGKDSLLCRFTVEDEA